MTDISSADLDKVLKQHRQMDTHAGVPRCAQVGCYKWPCLPYRMATELRRRRDIESRQERMAL